jgi:hypothetical protein
MVLKVCFFVLFFCHPCEGRDPEEPQPKQPAPCVSNWKHQLLALDARLRGHDGGMAQLICFVFLSLGHLQWSNGMALHPPANTNHYNPRFQCL